MDATIAFIEANLAVGESEEGVIATHADVGASMEAGAALADDNGSCGNGFATETWERLIEEVEKRYQRRRARHDDVLLIRSAFKTAPKLPS